MRIPGSQATAGIDPVIEAGVNVSAAQGGGTWGHPNQGLHTALYTKNQMYSGGTWGRHKCGKWDNSN